MSASASAATAESRRRPYIPRRRPSEGTSAERKRLNRVSTESGASDDVDHDEEDDDIPICPSPFRTEYAAVMQPEQPNNFGRPRRRRGPCLRVGWCTVLQVTALAALAIANWFFVQPGSSGGYHPDLTRISSSFSARASPPPRPAHAGAPPATPSTDAPPPAAPPSVVAAALDQCPPWAPALGFGGAAVALIFSSLGSAYGTGKAATGVSAIGVHDPGLVMKMLIPVVMAGVLGIYGLIIAVIIADGVRPFSGASSRTHSDYSLYTGVAHLAAGLVCGLSAVSAGIAIGIVGDAGVRASAMQRKVYVGMVLILIFAEALGLYGLIVGLILAAKSSDDCGLAPG